MRPVRTALLSRETVAAALGLVTTLAAETIPGTTGAGVTLEDLAGHKVTLAASHRLVEPADRRQYELDDGPCLTAWRERAVVRVDDVLAERRWPAWSRTAAELGLRSSVSAPLVAGRDCLGAIKVYSTAPRTYGPRAEHLLTMFAAQCAVFLANMQSPDDAQRRSDELKEALRRRDVIGMGKGVLIARDGYDETHAFAALMSASLREGRKLRDVAEDLVHSVQQGAARPAQERASGTGSDARDRIRSITAEVDRSGT